MGHGMGRMNVTAAASVWSSRRDLSDENGPKSNLSLVRRAPGRKPNGVWSVKLKNGDTVCQSIESQEWEAPAETPVFVGTRQTKRLRRSVALPATDNSSSLR